MCSCLYLATTASTLKQKNIIDSVMAQNTTKKQGIALVRTINYSLDSEGDFRSGCRNVSHQQQFFSELPSPERSQMTIAVTIPKGRGGYSYVGYIGMWGPKEYAFSLVLVKNRVWILVILVSSRV